MDAPPAPTQAPAAAANTFWRIVPVALVVAAIALAFGFGLHRQISFATLAEHRVALIAWVASHGWLAPLLFMLAYALLVAISLPVIGVLSVAAGFLFGTWAGGIYSVIAATVGAAALHAATYTALGAWITRRAGSGGSLGAAIERLRLGFQRDAFSYIVFLRVVPVVPGVLTNLVPALMGVPLGTYVAASLVGFIPMLLVLAGIGSGVGAILARGATPDLAIVLEPPILLPMLALGVLSLAPMLYRRFVQR